MKDIIFKLLNFLFINSKLTYIKTLHIYNLDGITVSHHFDLSYYIQTKTLMSTRVLYEDVCKFIPVEKEEFKEILQQWFEARTNLKIKEVGMFIV